MPSGRQRWVSTLTLCLVALALVPLAGEIFARAMIALEVEPFRDPGLYADWFDDDDYWKLHHSWVKKYPVTSASEHHPRLGWTRPLPFLRALVMPGLLFLGDSFVEGLGPPATRLPEQLNRLLPGVDVYNLGVGGYGLDQILLRYREVRDDFAGDVVLVGVLTGDLDRSMLTVRTGPKPFFRLAQGELVLHGVPVPADGQAWLAEHPPELRSYAWAWLRQRLRVLAAGGDPLAITHRREEKQRLNARLLEALVAESREGGAGPAFVIFCSLDELDRVRWRERFLNEQLTRLRVPFINSKDVLMAAATAQGRGVEEFYDPVHQHLTPEGNRVVAEAIADRWGRLLVTAQVPIIDGNTSGGRDVDAVQEDSGPAADGRADRGL